MGIVIKNPVAEEQVHQQAQELQNKLALDDLQTQLNNENNARIAADNTLTQNLNTVSDTLTTEINSRSAAVKNLNAALSTEIDARVNADNQLQRNINLEIAAREESEENLRDEMNTLVDKEKTARSQEIQDTKNAILASMGDNSALEQIENEKLRQQIEEQAATQGAGIAGLTERLATEEQTRTSAVSELQGALSEEIQTRKNADNQIRTDLTENFNGQLQSETLQLRSYVENKVVGIEARLKDFVSPTATEDGESGFVPRPVANADLEILTNKGWKSPGEAALTISTVPTQLGTLTYNGQTQYPTWLNFDTNKLQITGTTSGTNAQTYTVKFKPLDLYMWADTLNQEERQATWKIEILKLPKPSAAVVEFDCDGTTKTLPVINYNPAYIDQTGTVSAIEPNSYSVTYSLKSTQNTTWQDNSTAAVTINWKINLRVLTAAQSTGFKQVGTLTYNGTVQTATIQNYNPTYHQLSGVSSSTNAGTFTAKIAPKNGCLWYNNTNTPIDIQWTIQPQVVTKPTAATVSFKYDGAAKVPEINNVNLNLMNQTGNTSATLPGNYTISYALKNPAGVTNYVWAGNTTANVDIAWNIGNALIAKPTCATTQFTYSGDEKEIVVANFNSQFINQTGTVKATAAGSYSAVYSLKDTNLAKWADGSVADVTINWNIAPKRLTATQSNIYPEKSQYDFLELEWKQANGYPSVKLVNFDENYVEIVNSPDAATHSYYDSDWYNYFSVLNLNYVKFLNDNASGADTVITNLPVTFNIWIKPKQDCAWSDGSTSVKKITWTLNKSAVPVPVLLGDSNKVPYRYKWSYHNVYSEPVIYTTVAYSESDSIFELYNYNSIDNARAAEAHRTENIVNDKLNVGQYSTFVYLKKPITTYWEGQGGNSSYNPVVLYWEVVRAPMSSWYYSGEFRVTRTLGIVYAAYIKEKQINEYVLQDKAWLFEASRSSSVFDALNSTYLKLSEEVYFKGVRDSWETTIPITISGGNTITVPNAAAGTYKMLISPTDNYTFPDGSTEPIAVEWEVPARPFAFGATYWGNNYAYDGTEKIPAVAKNFNIDSETETDIRNCWLIQGDNNVNEPGRHVVAEITGTFRATEPGAYTARVTIYDPNFMFYKTAGNSPWGANVIDDYNAEINWSISAESVTPPKISATEFEWSGDTKTVTFTGVDTNTMTVGGTLSASAVGEYSATVTLNSSGVLWSDGSPRTKAYTWYINRKKLTSTQSTFSQSGTLNYDGSAKTVTISNYDSNYHNLSGTTSATNAGVYYATITPKDNYCWSDGTCEPKVVSWTINGIKIAKPTASTTEFTYDGQSHSIDVSNLNTTYIELVSGSVTSSTNAGEFSATYRLKNTTGTTWADSTTDAVIISWKINKRTVSIPTCTTRTFVYDGTQKSITVTNFDSTYSRMVSGTTSAKAAGNYVAVYRLNNTNNTCWTDNSISDISIEWSIGLTPVNIPKISNGTFTYDGNAKTPSFSNYNSSLVTLSGDISAVNAGEYTITASISDTGSYCWSDGSNSPFTYIWKINRKALTAAQSTFSMSGDLTYNGENQNVSSIINNFSTDYHQMRLDVVKKDAGTYTVHIVPRENYCWNDSSMGVKVVNWAIKPLQIPKVTASTISFIYDKTAKTLTPLNYNADYISQSGTISATAAGEYAATFKLNSSTNLQWQDNTTNDIVINWVIGKKSISMPYATVTRFEYDGQTKTLSIKDFDSTYSKLASGKISASALGNYSAVYSLIDKNNTQWLDGSDANISIEWSIGLSVVAAPAMTVSTFTYDGNNKAPTFTNWDTAKVTLSGDTSAVNAGTYTITATLNNTSTSVWDDNTNSPKTFTWKINRKTLTAAQSTFSILSDLTYNGQTQSVAEIISGYNANYHVLGGTTQIKATGIRTVTISPNPNYCWNDLTTAAKSLKWTIKPRPVAKPTATATSFFYDKQTHAPNIQNYNSEYMTQSGTLSASGAGVYLITYKLKSYHCWEDSSTDDVVISWNITKRTLTIPTAETTEFTYGATQRKLTITGYDGAYMTQTGDIQATAAGDYSVTFSLNDKTLMQWEDSSTDDVTINWKINKAQLSLAESTVYQKTIPTYSGNLIVISDSTHMSGYSASYHNWSGTTSATAAGEYTAYVEPKPNYIFYDGTTEKRTVKWKIAPAQIATPALDESVTLTYDGTAKTVQLVGYDADKMTLGGVSSAVNAGEYTANITPAANYVWQDGTQDAVEIIWQVERQTLSFTPNGKTFNNTAYSGYYDGVTRDMADFINNYDENYMTLSGNTVLLDYTPLQYVHVTAKNNYKFADGRTQISLIARIFRRNIPKPQITNPILSYTGSVQSPTFSSDGFIERFTAIYGTVSGTTSAAAQGNYSITFKLNDKSGKNCRWQSRTTPATYDTDDLTVNWSIGVTSITAPTLNATYFDYTGGAISPTINGFDSATITKTGTESASVRGFYKITFSLKDKAGTCWSTGGSEDIVVEWAIGKTRIAKPAFADGAETEFTYDGTAKSISLSGFDSATMTRTGYLSATDAGEYSVVVSLKDTTAYIWEDSTTSDITFNWKINKAALPDVVFSQQGTLTYDGTSKTVSIKNYDASKHDITGTSAVAAGNHTAKITPKANYTWQNGSVTAKNVSWKINPKSISKPVVTETALEYTGGNQSLAVNYNTTYVNQNGTISASDTGVYSAVFSLKNKTNTIWEDSTTEDVIVEWRIGAVTYEKPRLSSSHVPFTDFYATYNAPLVGFDSNTMTKTGTDSVTNPADIEHMFKITIGLKDKNSTAWADGTTRDFELIWYIDNKYLTASESTFAQDTVITYDGKNHSYNEAFSNCNPYWLRNPNPAQAVNAGTYTETIYTGPHVRFSDGTNSKEISWTISKATPTLTLPTSIINLNDANLAMNVTVDTPSDGALSVRHSNDTVATTTIGGKIITVTAALSGTDIIMVDQADTQNYNAASIPFTVNVVRSLNSYTWAEIAAYTKAGTLADVATIGATKQIAINGTVGILSINATYCAVLLSIDHNAGIEGGNRAHFAIMKTSDATRNICFTDSKYGTTGNEAGFRHSTGDTSPAYGNSLLRARCNEMFNALPAELQNVITACKKYIYSNGYITSVTDKIWLPSVYEIDGKTTEGGIPVAYLEQYEYFANGNSKVCNKHSATTVKANYWTRDAYLNVADGHIYINTSGTAANTNPNYSYGFLPCFTIS